MAFEQRSLDDYVDVAQRIADFRALYPEGTLRPHDPAQPWRVAGVQAEWCRQCIGRRQIKVRQDWKQCPRCDGTGLRSPGEPMIDYFIVYVAAAYRTPDDAAPGIGAAWEPYPGQTPYTLGSELMNAETSAWGRAIIAVGASDSKRGIASREEVRNRQAEREDGLPAKRDGSTSRSQVTDTQLDQTGQMTRGQMADHNRLERETQGRGPQGTERLSTTPVDDKWYDAPPAPIGESTEDQPGTIIPVQNREMHALFGQLGITDKAQRLDITRNTLKLDMLGSSSRLSYRQAADLITALRQLAGEQKAAAT
jgi:hypothetical protein